jgi:hypothetical protein
MGIEKKIVPEVWLRGPLPGLSPFLQPVAHALLQAREEVRELMEGFPEQRLWDRPAGLASPGYHLQHLAGVLDRLFTYARGERLSDEQLKELADEGKILPVLGKAVSGDENPLSREGKALPGRVLVDRFARQVDLALDQLRNTPESLLTDTRGVGREQLPSTVLGLLVHAAEHVQRHTGQLLVTTRILHLCPEGPLPDFLQQGGKK